MRAAMKTASAEQHDDDQAAATRATRGGRDDDGHRVPGSGAPTAPPRNPVPDT